MLSKIQCRPFILRKIIKISIIVINLLIIIIIVFIGERIVVR